ncbi:MAG: hypothetical protein ACE5PM_01665 [Candidatus Hydrothermarchaeales archaeon]
MKPRAISVFLVLAIIISLPNVQAQGGLYVPEYNITYTLYEDYFLVEEKIVFGNTQGTFTEPIYLYKGDAANVTVEVGAFDESTKYSVNEKRIPMEITLNMRIYRGATKEITITYTRTDLLNTTDNIKVFKGYALGRYPWDILKATVKFLAPRDHQFGNITPLTAKRIVEGREEISYDLALPLDEVFITYGLPVEIEYAKFEDLALAKMEIAKSSLIALESEIESANTSIENADIYGANLTEALELYNRSKQYLDKGESELSSAELAHKSKDKEFYRAYLHAITADKYAKEGSEKATKAQQLANFEVQRTLNEKIAALTSSLTMAPTETPPPEATTPPPTTSAPTTPPPATPPLTTTPPRLEVEVPEEMAKPKLRTPFIALLIILIIAVGVGASIGKRERPRRRGKVKDFRVISDLKRKTFRGFEEKVDKVKRGVDVATEIRRLRSEREKLESDIEDLDKKRALGEIEEEAFEADRKALEEGVEKIDSQLKNLEKELRKIKGAKR